MNQSVNFKSQPEASQSALYIYGRTNWAPVVSRVRLQPGITLLVGGLKKTKKVLKLMDVVTCFCNKEATDCDILSTVTS